LASSTKTCRHTEIRVSSKLAAIVFHRQMNYRTRRRSSS
jgi:hypothetical protein